ncbi:hypothetical protein [Lactococcus garvieae]|uniref:Uncharacterized protein n=1 Tax=Lactococcus garvieae TaxID=1363 RepID=A0A1I4GG27_9LACT|nr:hypothetical protein [Lactococcus garvieae]SFL29032.1 hypothetical protein SAMN05216438_10420 [Lactococcus garvieae]
MHNLISNVNVQHLASNLTMLASNSGVSTIKNYMSWALGVVGGLVAIIGVISFFSSGHAGDAQGKVSGAWLIAGGIAIIGCGVLVGIFLTTPPTS